MENNAGGQEHDPYELHPEADAVYFGSPSAVSDDAVFGEDPLTLQLPAVQEVPATRRRFFSRRAERTELEQVQQQSHRVDSLASFPWQRFVARCLVWLVSMVAISALANALPDLHVPQTAPTLGGGVLGALLILGSLVVAWRYVGDFPSTVMASTIGVLASVATVETQFLRDATSPSATILTVFLAAFLLGLAAEVGYLRLDFVKKYPILPSLPVTIALLLTYVASLPLAASLVQFLSQWFLPLLAWLKADFLLAAPAPTNVIASWLLAFFTGVFVCRGQQIASSSLVWKTPTFILAALIIAWQFTMQPQQVFAALVIAGAVTLLAAFQRL